MYSLMRPWLFCLDPERAHHLGMEGLRRAHQLGLTRWLIHPGPDRPVECLGLRFPNAVGLAAGMDKNAEAVDAFAAVGFGFVEVGTLTPRPQPGNPRPRLFRIPEAGAIINRMGFNNEGIDAAVARLKRRRSSAIVGVNIGKNADTPLDRAAEDYTTCLAAAYETADYLVLNISSPNTRGLRELQNESSLPALLATVAEARQRAEETHQSRVPFLVKIAPDVDDEDIDRMAETVLQAGFDGLIATNTTIDRSAVADHPLAGEAGGLSGRPLRERSRAVMQRLRKAVGPSVPLIGVGGISEPEDASAMLDAGATLIQLYTGLIFKGPGVVPKIKRHLAQRADGEG